MSVLFFCENSFISFSFGTFNKNSDIDLYIVTQDEFILKNFKEESEMFLEY